MSNNLARDTKTPKPSRSETNPEILAQNATKIRQVYDQAGKAYQIERAQLRTQKYLTKFCQFLPKQAHVLDLGCGAGVPVDDILLQRGFLVTGLDNSKTQLAMARASCPRGEFLYKDLQTLQPGEFTVDGIVCLYTLFHLPRITHQAWLTTIASFLKSGDPLLISLGETDFEGWHDFYGQQIWSSQWGVPQNRALLQAAGFEIHSDELDRSGREIHQMVIATKR